MATLFSANWFSDMWSALSSGEKMYIIVIIAFIPVTILGIFASYKVDRTFVKYSQVIASAGRTASQIAREMLDRNGLKHVSIQRISGNLTDNFDPRNKVVSLSDSVYNSASIAAIGVACHECGHAIQHENEYFFAKIRSAMVPVLNFSNKLLMPILLVGMLLGFLSNTGIGNVFVYIGIVLFGLSALFSLITLPTEFNASARAQSYLRQSGMVSSKEAAMSRKVLTAAAMTYIAAFLASLVQFLRFVAIILMRTNRRK